MNFLYNICSITLWINLKIWSKYKVVNKEFIPKKGKLLVISNHQSNIDAGLLGASINRRLRFPTKIELFKNPVMSFFLKIYGGFPIKRDSADISSFKTMKSILDKNNGTMAIFPEGTRDNGKLVKSKSGTAKIAKMFNPIILPVAITGTLHLKGLFRVFNPSGSITVTIGKPFKLNLDPKNDMNDKKNPEKLTTEIMNRISQLLPEEKRGDYPLTGTEKYLLTETEL